MQIKNLTNSPYSLTDKDGKVVMLPARGTVDIEPHPLHVNQYRQVGYFEIVESEGSEKTEASEKAEVSEKTDPRDALRAKYEELTGESADKRWSESRLRTEIDALLET